MNIESLLSAENMGQVVTFVAAYGIKIITAIAIFIVGRWIAKKATAYLGARMSASNVDITVSQFVQNILYYIAMVVIIIAALGQIGIQTASFVAIIAAAGLAVGLALQGSLANFAAGVLLILFRPVKVGDFAEVAGVAGVIQNISIFSTTLTTGDNKTIIAANASVMGSNIINYSTQATRRVDLVIGVSYDSNIEQVKTILKDIADSDERVLKDKEVTIGVVELGDSSVNLVFRPWVNSADYWGVHFDFHERVKSRFDEAGIGIPYPTMDVNIAKD